MLCDEFVRWGVCLQNISEVYRRLLSRMYARETFCWSCESVRYSEASAEEPKGVPAVDTDGLPSESRWILSFSLLLSQAFHILGLLLSDLQVEILWAASWLQYLRPDLDIITFIGKILPSLVPHWILRGSRPRVWLHDIVLVLSQRAQFWPLSYSGVQKMQSYILCQLRQVHPRIIEELSWLPK